MPQTFGGRACSRVRCKGPLKDIVPLKYIRYEVYGDLIIIYPKPYSICD